MTVLVGWVVRTADFLDSVEGLFDKNEPEHKIFPKSPAHDESTATTR